MKVINQTLASPIGRSFIYLSIFIVGSALVELLIRLIHPVIWSTASTLISLTTLATFTLIGALFACQPRTRSRVTSAATLLILGVIALSIGRRATPDPYLLVFALTVAAIGALPVLHRKSTSLKQTVWYSCLTVVVALAVATSFVYGMKVIDSLASVQNPVPSSPDSIIEQHF